MRIYDLSHQLNEHGSIYPNDPVFNSQKVASIKDDGYNVTSLSMGSHTGTHIDAPYHFFENGKKVDEIDLSWLIGPAIIADLRYKEAKEEITWDDLSAYHSLIRECCILVIHTGWSQYWSTSKYFDHPYLTRDAAEKIIANGIRVLCVDTLNPDQTNLDGSEGDFGVHEVVLGAGCVIEFS